MCPDSYVVLEELRSHIIENKKYVDEVALIKVIEDSKEVTRKLVRSKGKQFVYHMGNKEIIMEMVRKPGYNGVIDYAN